MPSARTTSTTPAPPPPPRTATPSAPVDLARLAFQVAEKVGAELGLAGFTKLEFLFDARQLVLTVASDGRIGTAEIVPLAPPHDRPDDAPSSPGLFSDERAILAALGAASGVYGSFVVTEMGRLLLRDISPKISDDVIAALAPLLLPLGDGFRRRNERLRLSILRYGPHALLLEPLRDGLLCVVAEASSLGVVRAAMAVAVRRLSFVIRPVDVDADADVLSGRHLQELDDGSSGDDDLALKRSSLDGADRAAPPRAITTEVPRTTGRRSAVTLEVPAAPLTSPSQSVTMRTRMPGRLFVRVLAGGSALTGVGLLVGALLAREPVRPVVIIEPGGGLRSFVPTPPAPPPVAAPPVAPPRAVAARAVVPVPVVAAPADAAVAAMRARLQVQRLRKPLAPPPARLVQASSFRPAPLPPAPMRRSIDVNDPYLKD